MRLLILLNILLVFWTKFNEIGVKNRIKQQAQLAYVQKDYSSAITHYKKLIEKYHVNDEKVTLNLANACFNVYDTIDARYYYQKTASSKSPEISSVANLQLGILEVYNENYEIALKYFKESLKDDSGNDQGRYNYELIKKLTQKKESNQKEKNKKEKENKEQKNNTAGITTNTTNTPSTEGDEEQEKMEKSTTATTKLNLSGKGIFSFFKQKKEDIKNEQLPAEKGNKESDVMLSNRLKKYHLNEAKAKALLESMKEEEVQYIQQLKKYQQTDYPKDKPDY